MIQALILFIAVQHMAFLLLEMVFWTRPTGRRVFGLDADFARKSAGLAANQGLYNGFLAAGLMFGLLHDSAGNEIVMFFLGCIVVAGIFGGITVSKTIFYVQAVPAIVTLALMISGIATL